MIGEDSVTSPYDKVAYRDRNLLRLSPLDAVDK
jgi:hypothetical protein